MPNRDLPFGLRVLNHQSADTSRLDTKKIASGYNTKITAGDPVTLLANGTIGRAAAGQVVYGVFKSVKYSVNGVPTRFTYWTANTVADDAVALVEYDPDNMYVVQCSGDFQADDVGGTADFSVSDGDDVYGSKVELGTIGTGAAQFKILGLYDIAGNDYGNNAIVYGKINENFQNQTAGV